MKYVVSKGIGKSGKEFYYCHKDGFSYIPVFGSIGSKSQANKICKEMNKSIGMV
jgi:hypothetical protein